MTHVEATATNGVADDHATDVIEFEQHLSPVQPPAAVLPTRVGAQFHASPPVSREQIARWQAELNAVVPPAERLASLHLRWEPGDYWQPVQRWVIWELVPNQKETKPGEFADTVPRDVRADLEGPSPRSTGKYDSYKKRWVGGPCTSSFVDHATWQLYHEIKRATGVGRWGFRWWVIQGENGGHPIQVPWLARRAKQLMGEPLYEMPSCGDLAYAEPGQRVWDKAGAFDKIRRWNMKTDWALRNMDHLSAEQKNEAIEYAANATAWWDEQCGEMTDELTRAIKRNTDWRGSAKGKETGANLTDENSRNAIESIFVDKA